MKAFIRILTWLGIMAGLTLLAMGVWYLAFGGGQTTTSLKWLQFLQTLGTFLIPPILCAWMWDTDHRPFSWLKMDQRTHWSLFVIAVGIMICAIPAINLLSDLNSRIELPESLASIEQILKQQEEAAALLTERFLQADNFGQLLLNLGVLALLPALAEVLSFRGTLQQILSNSPQDGLTVQRSVSVSGLSAKRSAVAIWATAFIFSAIHMQFYGFIPRMLMGAMFGYVFVWSGSLWLPVLMHFTNNALAVLAYHFTANSQQQIANSQQPIANSTSIADTLGAGDTWYIGLISILITSLGLLIFYRRTRTR